LTTAFSTFRKPGKKQINPKKEEKRINTRVEICEIKNRCCARGVAQVGLTNARP
jgi:hypothetical protein